jgi:hypothetical protein
MCRAWRDGRVGGRILEDMESRLEAWELEQMIAAGDFIQTFRLWWRDSTTAKYPNTVTWYMDDMVRAHRKLSAKAASDPTLVAKLRKKLHIHTSSFRTRRLLGHDWSKVYGYWPTGKLRVSAEGNAPWGWCDALAHDRPVRLDRDQWTCEECLRALYADRGNSGRITQYRRWKDSGFLFWDKDRVEALKRDRFPQYKTGWMNDSWGGPWPRSDWFPDNFTAHLFGKPTNLEPPGFSWADERF